MKLQSKVAALVGAGALLMAVSSTAFAASTYTSPHKVDADTTQLNWNGSQGLPLDSKCGDSADPGSGGFQNGGSANDYLLWIFTTDGGSVSDAPSLTIDGTTYTSFHATGQYQIVTPGIDPSTITDAHVNFTVGSTGNGDWILTISHGCVAESSSSSSSSSLSSSSSSTSFTSSESGSSSTVSSTTSSSTSFSGSESGATEVPSQPNTATIGDGTSSPSNGAWLLVAALGALVGSIVVLTPAKAKNRR